MSGTINVSVTGEFVSKDGKNAGTQGEGNSTYLKITMSEDWQYYSKRILWRNSLGENPVSVLLYNSVTDSLSGKDPLVFTTPIPSEPMTESGWCSFTLEGFRNSAPTSVLLSVTDYLLVEPNDDYNSPAEPTPTQAMQLQSEIDSILSEVNSTVSKAISEMEEAETSLKDWGAWDSNTWYLPTHKVSRKGSSYFCLAQCKGIDPSVDVTNGISGSFWLMIASKGDQGNIGPSGSQGKTGETGSEGPQGPQGPQGVQGIQGKEGPQGINGVAVSTAGMVSFDVDANGHLICSYTGDTQPNYYINSQGHLCLDI